jgi:hypothetical protein
MHANRAYGIAGRIRDRLGLDSQNEKNGAHQGYLEKQQTETNAAADEQCQPPMPSEEAFSESKHQGYYTTGQLG